MLVLYDEFYSNNPCGEDDLKESIPNTVFSVSPAEIGCAKNMFVICDVCMSQREPFPSFHCIFTCKWYVSVWFLLSSRSWTTQTSVIMKKCCPWKWTWNLPCSITICQHFSILFWCKATKTNIASRSVPRLVSYAAYSMKSTSNWFHGAESLWRS
jgi:hypothetical protein